MNDDTDPKDIMGEGSEPKGTFWSYLWNLVTIIVVSVPLLLLSLVIGIVVRLHIESFMVGYRIVERYIIN